MDEQAEEISKLNDALDVLEANVKGPLLMVMDTISGADGAWFPAIAFFTFLLNIFWLKKPFCRQAEETAGSNAF